MMVEKFVYYNNLFDLYGSFLTDKNADIFALYYRENLTMQEIADRLKVTKSFIGNSIKTSESKLEALEKDLQLYAKQEQIAHVLESNDIKYIKTEIKRIIFDK